MEPNADKIIHDMLKKIKVVDVVVLNYDGTLAEKKYSKKIVIHSSL
jgi:hypothetical protein